MRRAVGWVIIALMLVVSAPVVAQGQLPAVSGIATFDRDRLFFESDFGIRVSREIEARGNELVAENRRIEAELEREEQALTDRRDTLTPEEFRPLADDFDTRVQATRQEQAAKSRALNTQLAQEREVFLSAATPILQALMAETGAAVLLEKRAVFISAARSDITTAAIERLNARLGEGGNSAAPPANQAQD